MRTAADFNDFYATQDPWRLAGYKFRDRVLRARLSRIVRGKTVLELGCGEGHLTEAVFSNAATVMGLDISDVAIARARSRKLSYARFECGDLLDASFDGYDVITAMECLYYLTSTEQAFFFERVALEHRGKILIFSGPIIGDGRHRRYFTHATLSETFARLRAKASFHNLVIKRSGPLTTLAAATVRLPLCLWLLDLVPEPYIFQRCYIMRIM
jgi:2-polyprenyl-3-methyl-5-hydroxy-6-metoxy-1,4-benzoquinol methylase